MNVSTLATDLILRLLRANWTQLEVLVTQWYRFHLQDVRRGCVLCVRCTESVSLLGKGGRRR